MYLFYLLSPMYLFPLLLLQIHELMLNEYIVPCQHFFDVGDIHSLAVIVGEHFGEVCFECIAVLGDFNGSAVLFLEDGLEYGLECHFVFLGEYGDIVQGGYSVLGKCRETMSVFE